MDIKEFFCILRRRMWVAIQAFLVIISATIAFTYLIHPTYETYAKLLIMTSPTSSSASLFSSTLKDFGSLVSVGSTAEISTTIAVASVRPVIVVGKFLKKGEGNFKMGGLEKKGKNYKIAVPILYNKSGKIFQNTIQGGHRKMIALSRNKASKKRYFISFTKTTYIC